MLLRVDGTYDVVEVLTVAPTELTFDGIVLHDYPIRAEVLPVSRCWADSIAVSKQLDYAAYDMKLAIEPVNNDLGLTAYVDGELSITDVNYGGPLEETVARPHYRLDGGYGLMSQTVILGHSDRGSTLGFRTRSRAELWALREKLYRLQGRAVAFYLATFAEELTANAGLTIAQSVLNIERCGYTEFVQNRRGRLRIHLAGGSVLSRNVLSSKVISPTTERLTMTSAWGATVALADIERIEYLELVRLDTDDVVLRHRNALGWASCEVPVVCLSDPRPLPGTPIGLLLPLTYTE
jgi:hypothetical protein